MAGNYYRDLISAAGIGNRPDGGLILTPLSQLAIRNPLAPRHPGKRFPDALLKGGAEGEIERDSKGGFLAGEITV